jgi:hypothetical protein
LILPENSARELFFVFTHRDQAAFCRKTISPSPALPAEEKNDGEGTPGETRKLGQDCVGAMMRWCVTRRYLPIAES